MLAATTKHCAHPVTSRCAAPSPVGASRYNLVFNLSHSHKTVAKLLATAWNCCATSTEHATTSICASRQNCCAPRCLLLCRPISVVSVPQPVALLRRNLKKDLPQSVCCQPQPRTGVLHLNCTISTSINHTQPTYNHKTLEDPRETDRIKMQ